MHSEIITRKGFTVAEVAYRNNVSIPTVRRWIKKFDVKVMRFSGTCICIPIEELERVEKEALS